MLVAAPRVASHFLDRVFSDANSAILDWPGIVRTQVTAPKSRLTQFPLPKRSDLLVSEIADIEGRILELPFELRSARASCQRVIKCPSMASATIQRTFAFFSGDAV